MIWPSRSKLTIWQNGGMCQGCIATPQNWASNPQTWIILIQTRKVRWFLTTLDCTTDANHFLILAVFLERLQSYPALPSTHIELLGKLYSLRDSSNPELRFRFYQVALLDPLSPGSKEIAIEATNWIVGDDGTGVIKGRMKYCRPVLRAAYKVDPKPVQIAFVKFKDNFHPIARRLLEKVSLFWPINGSIWLISLCAL